MRVEKLDTMSSFSTHLPEAGAPQAIRLYFANARPAEHAAVVLAW
jgi:hypothetical protein